MDSGSDDVWALLQEIGQQQDVNLQLAEEQASIEHEIGVKERRVNLKIPALKRKLESEKRLEMLSEQILVSFSIKGSGLMQWSRQLTWYKFFNYSTCIIQLFYMYYYVLF